MNRLEPGQLKAERGFLAETERIRSAWWGDVLTTLNRVVQAIRQGKLENQSSLRMADWESLGRVIAKLEGREVIWDKFVAKLKDAQSEFLLEGEPLADGLDRWLTDSQNHGREVATRELYEELTRLLFGDKKPTQDWPKSARG